MATLKWGLIDRSGKQVVPCRYDFLWPVSLAGVFPATLNGTWRYYNLDESIAFPGEFQDAFTHREGRAVVKLKGKERFINECGAAVGTASFDSLDQLSEGMSVAERKGLFGYVNQDGTMVTPFHFPQADALSCGRGLVRSKEWKWGFVDRTGKVAIPLQFDDAESFCDDLAYVQKKTDDGEITESGYINLAGEYAFRADGWGCGGHFSEGLASATFMYDGELKQGYLNRRGELAIEPQFDHASLFHEGRGCVKIAGRWGAIDPSGKLVIQPRFKDSFQFFEGLAEFNKKDGGQYGYIGTDGRELIPIQFDHACEFRNGFARVAMRQ